MPNITNELITMQNTTKQNQAANASSTAKDNTMGQDAFLKLLMTELSNQDPLKPMDNTEFISQQAQFTQINELQKMNDSVSSGSEIVQASMMIGKDVTVKDPDDAESTITGKVTSATVSDGSANVTINGKEYPVNSVLKITEAAATTSSTNTTTDTNSST